MTTKTSRAGNIPAIDINNILNSEWDVNNVPKPRIYAINTDVEPPRVSLNIGDYVTVGTGVPAEVEEPIGTWIYANRRWQVTLDLSTKHSKERLWAVKNEIRRICHMNMHSLPNYQRIQYKQFSEMMDQQLKVWQGKIDIELVSSAVILDRSDL